LGSGYGILEKESFGVFGVYWFFTLALALQIQDLTSSLSSLLRRTFHDVLDMCLRICAASGSGSTSGSISAKFP
jgi:hypothetical protein